VYKTSVTFVQAGFPIFTLAMIYKTIAPPLGGAIYLGDIIGSSIVTLMLVSPLILILIMTKIKFTGEQDIDAGVYDEGFLVRQSDWTDVAADNMVFILPIILFTQIAIALLYIKKNAWTKERLELWREKQEE
jgi:Ca2+/Na+ antiporter